MKKRKAIYQILLRFLPKAYVETSISAGLLAYACASIAQFDFTVSYAFFLFFATLGIYNLLRSASLFRSVQNVSFSTMVDALLIPIHLAIGLIAGLIALFFLAFISFDLGTYLLIALLFVVAILYRFKWLRVNNIRTALSDLPYLKAFFVALVWTILCVTIPMQNSLDLWRMSLAAFLYFLGLSIPFDIRDLYFDKPQRRTIPQVLGRLWSHRLSALLIALGYLLVDFGMSRSIIILSIGLAIHILLILQTNPNQSRPWLYRLLDWCPVLFAWYLLDTF